MTEFATPLLTVERLGKSFRGLQALEAYNLVLQPGELLGVIGPNGAGKTTLFNLLTGITPPTTGVIRLRGVDITGRRPDEIARLGVARTFQKVRLFPALTVLENLRIPLQMHERVALWQVVLRTSHFLRSEAALTQSAYELLALVDLVHAAHKPAAQLSYGQQRRLELACALALRPRLLLLDEPAAGMNPTEADALMHLILRLHQEFELTTILIEHNMRLIMNMCSRIQVLNYGQLIAEGTPAEIQRNPQVVEAYLGQVENHGAG
ncbi:ABC transporter ATP-binding protein [Caldilinea sp.]|jgi:branched-chain amino acid transport system ATP-binding protein|uniref:ABC transporter ATP-binding protein n=1 Tax=Caldilinea sp. TaxID=2293560 RepID=UPI001B04E424|nr:ABC transporter ATP-binding protein [Caldilinea sp.]MBO9392973.1 ABC transporter ATP-binding protein [Caldilinea sp.]